MPMMKKKKSILMRLLGNKARKAPVTPAIEPLAPMIGLSLNDM